MWHEAHPHVLKCTHPIIEAFLLCCTSLHFDYLFFHTPYRYNPSFSVSSLKLAIISSKCELVGHGPVSI